MSAKRDGGLQGGEAPLGGEPTGARRSNRARREGEAGGLGARAPKRER